MKMLTEKEGPRAGEPSFSRSLPFFFAGLITAVWLGVGAWMIWRNWGGEAVNLWDSAGIGSYMTWGRDFFFVAVMPYVGNKLSKIGGDSE